MGPGRYVDILWLAAIVITGSVVISVLIGMLFLLYNFVVGSGVFAVVAQG